MVEMVESVGIDTAPAGVIVGGWSFVVAAYSITAAGLILYTWSLLQRIRRQKSKEGRS
jgi:hypothetical protein